MEETPKNWTNRSVAVTGRASFIGCNFVDALIMRGAKVRVVDDLSSEGFDNLRDHAEAHRVKFMHWDLR